MSIAMLSLLTPKNASLQPHSSISTGNISPADIVSALSYSKLSEHDYHYILAKYCQDENSVRKLWENVSVKIRSDIVENGWQDQPGRHEHLATIVIYELVYAISCPHCQKTHTTSKNETVCGRCRGTGKHQISAREQEKITGISKSSWSRTWRDRINTYIFDLQTREELVSRRLKKQLYGTNSTTRTNKCY